jgi:hypothetical protein
MGIPAAAINFAKSAGKYVSPELVRKGLEKISPKFKSYFAQAITYGFSANQALDYIIDRFSNPNQQQFQKSIEQRGSNQQLRPDEMEAQSQMATSQLPGKVLKSAAALAAPMLAGGGEAAPEEAPAESPMKQTAQKAGQAAAPVTQAYKGQEGLSTPVISGRAAASAQTALGMLKGKANRAKTAPQAPQSANAAPATSFDILKKRHPVIGAFLEKEMGKGKTPFEAAAAARNARMMKTPISQIETETAQPFEGVIAQVFGLGGQQSTQAQPQAVPAQDAPAEAGDAGGGIKELGNLIQQYIQSKGVK